MFDYSIKDSRSTNIIEKILLHIRNEIRALHCIFTPDSAVLIIDVTYEDDNLTITVWLSLHHPVQQCTLYLYNYIKKWVEINHRSDSVTYM